jgi:hypothetical protein
MAMVTIDGFSPDIQTQGASEHTRSDQRARTEGIPTYNGGLRRQGVARKREWQFTTVPLAQSDFATLITKAYGAPFRSCTGDALGGVATDCVITVDEGAYVEDTSEAVGFKRVATITLREK